jgi:hypothetical protein
MFAMLRVISEAKMNAAARKTLGPPCFLFFGAVARLRAALIAVIGCI